MGTVHDFKSRKPKNTAQFEGPIPRVVVKAPKRRQNKLGKLRLKQSVSVAATWIVLIAGATAAALLN